MNLISIKNAYLSFNNLEILKNVSFYINSKERICLAGKNGSGKSTLLKVINKQQDLDHGLVVYKKNIKIQYLQQNNLSQSNISIFEFIKKQIEITKKEKIKINDIVEIKKITEILKLNQNSLLSEVSGGILRKVALSAILINKPDILLLDEPTNHLDIYTIKWLEIFLKNFHGSIVFTSHDVSFIENISTKIIYIDRGKLIFFPGNYNQFIQLKDKNNYIEKINKKLFNQKLKKEEIWIRKSVKARTTRNEGRIKNLEKLRKENKDYKKIENFQNITINEIKDYAGKIIFKLKNIYYAVKNKTIIKNFSETIEYGDKIGLIGSNGSGKSTMIKILIGENQIQKGDFYTSNKLKIAYFDQNRSILNQQKSILDNINEGRDKIIINNNEQNLIGYLKKFLFKSEELKCLVKNLSGGESNRLLLAKIFLKPNNILIFDEPTNDLDLDTLNLLKNIINQYSGTVLIVSHDRNFLEKTVKKYWFFQGDGIITTHLNFKNSLIEKKIINDKINNQENNLNINKKFNLLKNKRKTKNKLKNILNEIENIENSIKILQNQINSVDFFKQDISNQLPILNQLNIEEKKLEKKIIHWEYLEKIFNQKIE
ncbi:ATP-binding protein Uup [Buchnera aphidicola (Protaphis terricola)]|uniref:ATP-binding cassette domain-containing protein n=1 Tax=Buchnera aphidicola TaxID=9 RepID=UPI003464B3A6